VVFTGDNGTDIPIVSRFKGKDVAGSKTQSIDPGMRVPLVAVWPGTIQSGMTNSDLVDFTDLMPTLLGTADIKIPDSLSIDGISFLPQLRGDPGTPRRWVYSWYLHPARKEPKVFVRNHKYKLYGNGDFVEVQPDYGGEKPIQLDNLMEGTRAVYQELQGVLVDNSKKRLNAVPRDGQD
jgi:arylsulfatase A